MFNLVKNELIKIFSKKSIYVILIIFLILAILTFVIDKFIEDSEYLNDIDEELEWQEDYLETIDTLTEDGKYDYACTNADIEILQLIKKYEQNSWKTTVIYDELYDIVIDMNLYKNGLNEYIMTGLTQEELEEEYNDIVGKLELDDWRSFVEDKLDNDRANLEFYKSSLNDVKNNSTIKDFQNQITTLEIEIQVLEWRLEKNICYGDEDFDDLLNTYESCGLNLNSYNQEYDIDERTYLESENSEFGYSQKKAYQETLSEFNIVKYKIENNISSQTTAAENLEYMVADMAVLFVVIIGIMIGATIIAEEFNKGTIKLLLVRPYSRRKILLAKLIACILTIIISILVMILIEAVISGIEYGFNTLGEPMVLYDYNADSVITMNVFKYLLIEIACLSPMIFIIAFIALMIGTISSNTSVASTITYLVYLMANIIDSIIQVGEGTWLKWAKYFPTVNWDFRQYLNEALPTIEGMTFGVSFLICLITVAVILVVTFEVFNRKNIKNV